MPPASAPGKAKAKAKAKADNSSIDDSNIDDTELDGPKTPKGDSSKKPKSVELTPVESLLFLNLVRFNPCPEKIDWEKVAQHSNLKNPASAKVRFRQILKKHGLEDCSPSSSRGQNLKRKSDDGEDDGEERQREVATPTAASKKPKASRKKAAGGGEQGKKDKKASEEPGDTAADQKRAVKAEEESEDFTGNGMGGLANAPLFAAAPPQAQLQAPQFGDGVVPQFARASPPANDVGHPFQLAASFPQQQQQQQQQQQGNSVPFPGAGFDPNNVYYCPFDRPGVISFIGGVTSGTLIHVYPDQFPQIQETCARRNWNLIQYPNLSASVSAFQQMVNSGGMAGMAGDPSGQSAQMDQPFAANAQPAIPNVANGQVKDEDDLADQNDDADRTSSVGFHDI